MEEQDERSTRRLTVRRRGHSRCAPAVRCTARRARATCERISRHLAARRRVELRARLL